LAKTKPELANLLFNRKLFMLTESLKHIFQEAEKNGGEAHTGGQSLAELAESIGMVFWVTDPAKSRIIYVSPGYEKIWGRTCSSLYASAGDWCNAIHNEDRNRVVRAAHTKQITGDYDEEYRIIGADGATRWIHDRAFPIRNESGEVHRIAGIAEDISERKRMEQEVIEMSDRELSRMGQELHDGICQQLVSIAFATDLLRRDLVSKSPPEALRVAKITALLDSAITQARHLSQALCPVNLIGNGLANALRELTGSISLDLRVVCDVNCAEGVLVSDHATATHLYRIAQAAIQRAVNHAGATRISIALMQEGQMTQLSITDNGKSIDEAGRNDLRDGFNVMRYRAKLAGTELEIRDNPFGGTVISCGCPQKMPRPLANITEVLAPEPSLDRAD
jgi:PAS domain S-box-containing protein